MISTEQTTKTAAIAEFTFKAVLTGILLGILFGAANAYLGLRVGMTVSASIPAAVMTVALFKLFRVRGTILEANLSQTIGSASTSLASGTIFTIPALFLWGITPPYWQVVALCFLGGLLGLSAMLPRRRLLILESAQELPYPEGTACAEVLQATAAGATGSEKIFWGMLVGGLVKLSIALFFLIPGEIGANLPFLPKAVLAMEIAPALIAVGFILGFRQSAIVVSGSVLSSFLLIPLIAFVGAGMHQPLFPETEQLISQMSAGAIWSRYVRYIGAGAVATAGILTVLKNLPAMASAFLAVTKGFKKNDAEEKSTDRDLPMPFVLGGILTVILVAGLVPGIFSGGMGLFPRLLCALGVALFGVIFVAVSARIVGLVGCSSNPVSGMTLVTLLGVASLFALVGWKDPSARAAVLTVGTIVCIAASKAGDISQDLKTGSLVGATPAKQQFGQLIGAAFACWAVAGTVLLLGSAYKFGTPELPAPQATLMKTIIEGVLSGDLPWNLISMGGGITLAAIFCGISGLAFAIGVYLPLASMVPIFVGGCVRALVDRGRTTDDEKNPGVLAASGLVAGEGLAGVLIAALVALKWVPKELNPILPGAEGLALLLVGGVCLFLFVSGRSQAQADQPREDQHQAEEPQQRG
ncbi:MAG: OPT family oligopeptide transporter [Bacteroidota bacterium]